MSWPVSALCITTDFSETSRSGFRSKSDSGSTRHAPNSSPVPRNPSVDGEVKCPPTIASHRCFCCFDLKVVDGNDPLRGLIQDIPLRRDDPRQLSIDPDDF